MFVLIMLYWIGQQLFAPIWYWILWWGLCIHKILSFGYDLYKKGAESR